jgi:hypothetical protein
MAIAVEQYRGDDREFDLFVTDEDGNAVDITGWIGFWYTAKKRATDTDAEAVIALSLGSGLTVQNAAQGQVRALSPASVSDGLYPRRYQLIADAQGKTPAGKVKTFDSGIHTILADVTVSTS